MDKRPRPAEAPPAPVESTPQAAPLVQATPAEPASIDEGVVAAPAVEGEPRAEPPVEMTEAATADPPAVEETVVATAARPPKEPVDLAAAPALAAEGGFGKCVACDPSLSVSA